MEWNGGQYSGLGLFLIHSSSGCCLIVGSLWNVSVCVLWVCVSIAWLSVSGAYYWSSGASENPWKHMGLPGSLWQAPGRSSGCIRDVLGSLLLHLGTHGSYREAVWKPREEWNGGHYSVLGCILFYYIVYCAHPVEWNGCCSSGLG